MFLCTEHLPRSAILSKQCGRRDIFFWCYEPEKPLVHRTGDFLCFQGMVLLFVLRVMRPTSVARWALDTAAAGGRCRRCPRSAAVEKIEEKRKPEDFFAYRKAARSDKAEVRGSSPLSATNIANQKRYRRKKSSNHNGYWIFYPIS